MLKIIILRGVYNLLQADARGMPEIASGRYDVLLDKGTLDAIATEGAAGKGDNQVSAKVLTTAPTYLCPERT